MTSCWAPASNTLPEKGWGIRPLECGILSKDVLPP